MKTAIKKFFLAIWLAIAVAAFAFGLAVFILEPSFDSYLVWGGVCAFVCIIHLIVDFCSKEIEGNVFQVILYVALCIVLGPLLILLFGKRTLDFLRSKPRKRRKNSSAPPADETPVETRQSDFYILFNAMEKAISSAVSRADIPDGKYVAVARKNIDHTVTKLFGIRLYGSITYKIKHNGPSRSADEYQRDIKDCLERAQQNLFRSIESAVESV